MYRDWFDAVMTALPLWLPALLVGLLLQWLIARSAAISALRKHERDRTAAAALRDGDPGRSDPGV